MLGFVVIVILYAVIGLMAATGCVFIARKIFAPKAEQIFYAMFLIMIAAFYLAFAAYFGVATAWRLETVVVLGFTAIALPGARPPFVLILGYSLHGVWDLLHELEVHGAYSVFQPGQLTPIPLAYGVFCAAFDLHGGVFLYSTRRVDCGVERTSRREDRLIHIETKVQPNVPTADGESSCLPICGDDRKQNRNQSSAATKGCPPAPAGSQPGYLLHRRANTEPRRLRLEDRC